jgi:hypothetical protein
MGVMGMLLWQRQHAEDLSAAGYCRCLPCPQTCRTVQLRGRCFNVLHHTHS